MLARRRRLARWAAAARARFFLAAAFCARDHGLERATRRSTKGRTSSWAAASGVITRASNGGPSALAPAAGKGKASVAAGGAAAEGPVAARDAVGAYDATDMEARCAPVAPRKRGRTVQPRPRPRDNPSTALDSQCRAAQREVTHGGTRAPILSASCGRENADAHSRALSCHDGGGGGRRLAHNAAFGSPGASVVIAHVGNDDAWSGGGSLGVNAAPGAMEEWGGGAKGCRVPAQQGGEPTR